MKLNVCLLNDSFSPHIDGVANAVINYAKIIQRDLGNATVVTPKYPNVFDHYDFPVYRYPSFNSEKAVGYRAGNPFGAKTLDELVKRNFDIIHSHCPMASGVLARMLRQRVNAPLIFTYHTKFDIEIEKVFSNERIANIAIRLMVNEIHAADEVWVVSEGAGENLRSIGYQGDYIVMENGVDIPCKTPDADRVSALRNKLKIAENIPVFLFVGRCMWYKGFRLSLNALKNIKEKNIPFKYVVVGDSNERPDIEAYAKSLGLAEDCIFVGSVTDRELLQDYFGMADLFLFPSTFDTNGLVVREAAACGLASMMIAESCASEGITHLRNGLLAEETVPSITEQILYACQHLPQMHQIGQTAQKEIYISWETSVRKAYQRYEYLHEKMKRGEMPRKDPKGTEFFKLLAEWNAAISKVNGMPRAVYDKFKK